MKKTLLTLVATVVMLTVQAETKKLVVDKNGSGDYTTISAAIEAVAEGEEAIIEIREGKY